jgi:uncharacterized repeat protein (TIGR01451 family)
MRLGIVLAATGAAAVTAWAVAAAQEWTDASGAHPAEPASGRTIHYFSRNGASSRQAAPAKPATVPGVRNYYDQLFAEPDSADEPTTAGVRTAGGTEADDAGLLHADHERQAGHPAAGTIRPVGSTGPALSTRTARARSAVPPAPRSALGQPADRAAGPVLPTGASADDNPFAAMARQGDAVPPQQEEPAAEPGAGAVEPTAQAGVSESHADALFQGGPVAPAANRQALGPAAAAANPFEKLPAAPEYVAPPTQSPSGMTPDAQGPAAQGSIAQGPVAQEPPVRVVEEPIHRSAESSGRKPLISAAEIGGPAAVEVRWEKVSEITVGRECRCELVVKNSGAGAAGEVAVEAFFPRSVRLTSAEPKPASADDHLTWTFSTLPAGAERRIQVNLIPSEQGDLKVSAFVRYTEAAAATLAVREPQLQVKLNGPTEVSIGEAASQTITVSNPGSGTADDVTVEVTLPAGLEHAKGRKLTMPIGSLAPGQSQVVRLALVATQGGPQDIHVRASSGQTLHSEAGCKIAVVAPSLKVAADGPSLRYVGRNAEYRVRVTNDGGAAANNVRVTQTVPEGFTFVRADKAGRFEAGTNQVAWFVGHLDAGQTVELAAELTASRLGSYKHLVSVFGESGVKADAAVQTEVDGVASLAVEVLDLDDPVEVGTETAYEIRVRNEGTKAAKNVDVACQVPTGVATLSARGPTEHRAGELNVLNFAPIGELEPGKTALYRIVVRGTAPGKHRFRVRLTSESIDEPLIHEELTHYYAD